MANRDRHASSDERAAAALTGGGPSQVGVNGAMRARDVSRPREFDVAEAERLVQVSYRPRSHPRPPLHSAERSGGRGGKRPDAS